MMSAGLRKAPAPVWDRFVLPTDALSAFESAGRELSGCCESSAGAAALTGVWPLTRTMSVLTWRGRSSPTFVAEINFAIYFVYRHRPHPSVTASRATFSTEVFYVYCQRLPLSEIFMLHQYNEKIRQPPIKWVKPTSRMATAQHATGTRNATANNK